MKLGLFGGTFDPIHNAHLLVAETARLQAGLERVLFLPAKIAHHRGGEPIAPAAARTEMVRLAIAGNTSFALDESDMDETSTGYTADLLPRLRTRYPEASFTWIAGGDSLRGPWNRLESVLAAVDAFLVAPRGKPTDLDGALANVPAALREKVVALDGPRVDISATLVRQRMASGSSARYLIPEPVWRYLTARNVYAVSNDDR